MTDFNPQRDVQAISHINVVAEDIEVATEFYRTVLGFEQAANADGLMDYPGVDLASFARNVGFDDGRVSLDVRFLKHPQVGVYLELFTYHDPGDQTIHRRKTNDLGGIRHVAIEVPDAVAAYLPMLMTLRVTRRRLAAIPELNRQTRILLHRLLNSAPT
jgi:catechol 2,3-dioxygenase-like lactoylglutathione lyase family enzyme